MFEGSISHYTIYSITHIGKAAFRGCESLTIVHITDLTSWCNIIFEDVTSNPLRYANNLYLNNKILTSLTIPKDIDSIQNNAFVYCSSLISVKIPNNVISIGKRAFMNCDNLNSVSIGDEVKSIGESAFDFCTSLASITIPDGVTSIEDGTFFSCDSLKSITIPEGVTMIGENAFGGCYSLASIKIPNSVISIGQWAFQNCRSLTTLTIGDGVTSISSQAFLNCSGLVSVDIPNVTTIRKDIFEGCENVTSVKIGDGVSIIESYAFSYCPKLKSVNVSSIKRWLDISFDGKVFSNDYDIVINGLRLTDLVTPNSISSIGKYAFYGYTGIESITLHKDVTTIVQNAFNGCKNVTKIVCQGDTPPVCGANALEGISRTDCTLYVPETSGSNYKNTAPWSEFTNIVGGGTDTPDTPSTCDVPTISFDNDTKKLVFNSATDGAECHYTITSDDFTSNESTANEVTMTGVYTITAYASADGMYNSDKTTAKLYWVSASMESDGIITAKAERGVVVSTTGNQINISGTVNGETIEVYNVGGSKVKAVNATGDNTTINGLQSGNVYVVKIGETKAKVVL